jgi:hypothetical protein
MEEYCEGPSASEHRLTSVLALAWVSALSHVGFSHRRGVLRPLFRMLHGLLRYQRSSACFDLSVYHFSIDLVGWPIQLPVLLLLRRSLFD